MITVLAVLALGGSAGVARYVLDGAISGRRGTEFPLGTLVVNLIGSFLLGLLTGLHASSQATLLLGTATIGSFTTFSTWMLETHRPAQDGEAGLAWRNLVVSLVLGLALALLGRALGTAL